VDAERGRLALVLVLLDEREHLLVDERDRGVDRVGRRDAEAERHAECKAQLVRVEHVGRVGHGDEERAVGLDADRKRAVPAREVLGQQRRCVELHVRLGELDERELVLLREHACDLRPGDEASLDEDLAQARAGRALLGERGFEILPPEEPLANEHVSQYRPGVMGRFHRQPRYRTIAGSS
jgi:hypothetical protein